VTRAKTRAKTRPQRLTSVENAAHYANVSTRSIRRWMSQGLITGYRVGPRLIKVDLDDLDRLAVPIPTAGGGPDAA
jgi:excisionase family DNA binding protein